jgi:hypothetical protein
MKSEPVLVETAARLLNVSSMEIRTRIRRGELHAEKDTTGRWRVYLATQPADDKHIATPADATRELIALRARIEHLEYELAERTNDRDYWRQAFQREQSVLLSLGVPKAGTRREVIPGI